MELKIGEYIIPDGCTIKRVGNIVKVYAKKQVDTSILRCRDCKHCAPNPNVPSYCCGKYCICAARTWGKKYPRSYAVTPSTKACDKFEKKEG